MSDLSILRWRIDQQSQLIMRLKLNLDESTSKLKEQEKINEDLRNTKNLVHNQIQEEEEKFKVLKKEFSQLYAAFEDLVKVKGTIKMNNLTLQTEISRIEAENKGCISAVVEEKSRQVQEKDRLIAGAQVLLGELDSKYSQLTLLSEADLLFQEKNLLESVHERTKAELEKMTEEVESELVVMEEKLGDIKKQREDLQNERKDFIERYQDENEDLILLIDERNEKIKEERILQNELEKQQEKPQKELALTESRYKSQKYLINPEMLLEKLSGDLKDNYAANQKALKEFAAYKTHAENLIKREQELNRKFQMLLS